MAVKKVSWGVLSTAKIGWDRALPALRNSALCGNDGISSRSPDKAHSIASMRVIDAVFRSEKSSAWEVV